MLHSYIKTSLLLLLITASGCNSEDEEVRPVYNAYAFDTMVIKKLPLYDSLATAIMQKLPLLQNHISKDDGYQAFRYMPTAYETGVYRKLPDDVGTDIDHHFAALDSNFIYGFDVFKDSTIKIYIRSKQSEKALVEIEENLSYYPEGKVMKHREFPIKDSILDKHWQYWIRFSMQGLF